MAHSPSTTGGGIDPTWTIRYPPPSLFSKPLDQLAVNVFIYHIIMDFNELQYILKITPRKTPTHVTQSRYRYLTV